MSAENATLLKTPFYAQHVALGAKMVPFAGFEMPVQYPSGITAEHNAVRERCGLFDVSHMGEFMITGAAGDGVRELRHDQQRRRAGQSARCTTPPSSTSAARSRTTASSIRFADHVMMVVNASNKDKDFAHISKHVGKFDVHARGRQRPHGAARAAGPGGAEDPAAAHRHRPRRPSSTTTSPRARSPAWPMIISRTGYTGEDGFELYHDVKDASVSGTRSWPPGDVTPAGLGCRDSLRLEMGMALYGNDIDDTVTPLEANLGWLVKLKKGDFVGSAALEAQKAAGVPRKLVGLHDRRQGVPAPRLSGVRERRAERRRCAAAR